MLGNAQDRAQRRLERQRAQARMQRERNTPRPRGYLALRFFTNRLGVLRHRGGPKGRKNAPATDYMGGFVEQHERLIPHDRLHRSCAVAGMQQIGGRGEHFSYLVAVGQKYERWITGGIDREATSVAVTAMFQIDERRLPHEQRLGWRRKPRSAGERRSRVASDPRAADRLIGGKFL
jgi:hypothetical protein